MACVGEYGRVATSAVSLMCSVDVKPKPPLLMEVKSRTLSRGVGVVLSHSSRRLTVIVSSLVAVAVSRPMALAVNVASLAVAVRHKA